VIIELIAATTTKTGLRIHAKLDPGACEKDLRVSDAEMAALSIEHADFHGEWNYLTDVTRHIRSAGCQAC
jgi:hypothetical protein